VAQRQPKARSGSPTPGTVWCLSRRGRSAFSARAKNTRLSGRVPSELIEAAKKRSHVSSDTELLELALSRLALEDDFGARLVRRKGSISADIDLGV